jgi:putative ABC transport system permease protein
MSSRWKKVWADFWSNKTRTFLVILTILAGTFGVGFVSNFSNYMLKGIDADFLSASPSEALVYAFPMNDQSVKIAAQVPGVGAVEGRSFIPRQVIRPDGSRVSIHLTAIENPSDLTVNTLQPVKGQTSIPPLGDREVLIDASAAVLGYEPGDLIIVEMGDGSQRELRLAGYLHAASSWPYNSVRLISAYVTPKTIQWLGGTLDYNRLEISVAENPTDQDHVTRVAQAVADRLERSGATVSGYLVNQPGRHLAYSWTQTVVFIMSVLGWLIVLLSMFLIINSITSLMTQQTRQIGIMKSTGGQTSQILGMYIALILSFGAIALMIAVPLSRYAAKLLGDGMAEYLGVYLSPYQGNPATLIQQIVVALVVPVLAALWPVYGSVRITVREALTDFGIRGGTKPPKRSVSKANLLIPRPIRISLRNTFRRKGRLSLTLITLVLAGAIFIAVSNLWASFDKLIEDYKGYYLADIIIGFEQPYRLDKVVPLAESVAGVKDVEGWLEVTGTLIRKKNEAGTQVSFIAPPSNSRLIQPILIAGRWLEPRDENAAVIGDGLVRMFPDLKVGDWLTIEIDGQETNWQIVGVYTFIGYTALYTNYEYLSQLIAQPGHAYSLRMRTDTSNRPRQQEISDQLRVAFADHGVRISGSLLGVDEVQRVTAQFDIFIYFVSFMALLIAVVGSISLMSTMSINVMERTREIGVLRAIGATNWNIQSIVVLEGIVIGVISWIFSILLSMPITIVLATGVGTAFLGAPLAYLFDPQGAFNWLIGTLIIGILASALPARSASRLTVKDTLAYDG